MFKILRQLYPQQDITLKAVTDLAFRLLRKPVAIWQLESRKSTLHIQAMTGITHEYFFNGIVAQGDNDIISQVLESGEKLINNYSDHVPQLQFRDHAIKIGWKSSLGFPIKIHEEIIGIIEVLSFEQSDLERIDDLMLRNLANAARAAIDNIRLVTETKQIADVTKELGKAADSSKAMKIIVNKARELTGADASAIFLFNEQSQCFVTSSYVSEEEEATPPVGLYRAEESLITRNHGKPVLISMAAALARALASRAAARGANHRL